MIYCMKKDEIANKGKLVTTDYIINIKRTKVYFSTYNILFV